MTERDPRSRLEDEDAPIPGAEDEPVYLDGEVEPTGRLTEGTDGRTDTPSDTVAYEVGEDAGGYTAEEEAVRITREGR